MQHSNRWRATLLVTVLAVGAAACSRAAASGTGGGSSDAVKVEPVKGTKVSKVILSQRAAERLGIKTDQVRDARGAGRRPAGGKAGGPPLRTVVPYAAVVYGQNGDTWTFTSPEPLTFVRQKIDVDYIAAGRAVLQDGSPVGTTVVTVGAAELLGAELGVGE